MTTWSSFWAELCEEDIETLKDGLELVRASRAVGRFVKWLILGILGTVVGTVMLYENVVKLIGWFSPPKKFLHWSMAQRSAGIFQIGLLERLHIEYIPPSTDT